jgi:hypothetical protein
LKHRVQGGICEQSRFPRWLLKAPGGIISHKTKIDEYDSPKNPWAVDEQYG